MLKSSPRHDWEHEEIFTDDDGCVENDPEQREDLGPEILAPPEIKQEDEISASPVLSPKQKDAPKEEPVDNSPLKPIASAPALGASSTFKSAKGKRKVSTDDAKATTVVPSKKEKTENDVKPVKEEPFSTSKKNVPEKGASSVPVESGSTVAGPVTEDEIRAFLTPVTTQDVFAKFISRLKGKEEKDAFVAILRRIAKVQKTANGTTFVVLREMKPDA